jgi:hypothetical protein
MPNGSIEIGKETKTSNNGKTTTSKKASQSAILGMKYTDDEIRKSMNEKKNGGPIKKAQTGNAIVDKATQDYKSYRAGTGPKPALNAGFKNGGKMKKAKAGAMIKRADGSMSRRGLWDNIRANKGSGKKPTKQMLVQEKKIKAKAKK